MLHTATEIAITQPTTPDIEAVAELRANYWHESWVAHGVKPEPHHLVLASQLRQTEHCLQDDEAYVRVARAGQRVVGWMSASIWEGQDYPHAHVGLLILAPDYRGQGLGTRFLKTYEDILPTSMPIWLSPYGPKDEALERFYGRLGFEWTEEDEDYMIKRRG